MLEFERVLGMSGLREIGWLEKNTGSINRCELVVKRQDTVCVWLSPFVFSDDRHTVRKNVTRGKKKRYYLTHSCESVHERL